MPENAVAEPAEPVGEESQASSRRRSCAISCAERGTTGEADEDVVDEGRSQPPEEAAGGDVERRAVIDEGGKGQP